MRTKEIFSILVTIAGFLLSGHLVGGQDRSEGKYVQGECHYYAVNAEDFCAPLTDISDMNILLANELNDDNACASNLSLQKYACARVDIASVDTLVSILKCFTIRTNVTVTLEALNLLISKLSTDILRNVMDKFTTQDSISNLREDVKVYMFSSILENIRRDKASSCPGFLATWFQERLYPFLSAINNDILNCVNTLYLTCDGFQAIVEAFDVNADKLATSKKKLIGSWISTYLSENTGCSKSSDSDLIFYRSFRDFVSYEHFIDTHSDNDLSLSLDMLSPLQLAYHANITNAMSNSELASPILDEIKKKGLTYIFSFLDLFSKLFTSTTYDPSVFLSLLETILSKLNGIDPEVCMPNFKAIFQVEIKPLLVGVNEKILNQLPSNMDCSTFRDIFLAMDDIYESLSSDNQLAVLNYRIKYLTAEVKKSGGACIYGVNSSTWLLNSFGASISYLTFADIVKINPFFNGYEALDILTINQTLDLILYSKILMEETKYSETQITALTTSLKRKGFINLREFLIEFRKMLSEYNIEIIKNTHLRCLMLESILEMLNSQFSLLSTDDWFAWFNEYLPIFLPCITRDQLNLLSVTGNPSCPIFQVIVKGLDIAFDHMDQNTKVRVVNWICDFLQAKKCDSSEWLKDNYQRFAKVADVSTLTDINPGFNPFDSLNQFDIAQLGQIAVVTQKGQTSVTATEEIFDVLLNISNEKNISNLGVFWDALKAAYEKETKVNFTDKVKYAMLSLTANELEKYYTSFDQKDFSIWFQKRLDVTLDAITYSILEAIPLTISCLSYKILVQALAGKYQVTPEANRNDVLRFLNSYHEQEKEDKQCANIYSSAVWIATYYGDSYFKMLPYEQLISYYPEFNAYEEGVLYNMSDTQIGDMIVQSETLENNVYCTKLFDYLETIDVTNADAIMEQLTQSAIKSNKIITNAKVATCILESYMKIVSAHIERYTEVQLAELLQKKITLLIKFITPQELNLIPINSCSSLTILVTPLNNIFKDLSTEVRKIISNWILCILKQPQLNGCHINNQPQSEWIQSTWLDFFQYAEYLDVISVYPTFNILTSLTQASISQKAYYLASTSALNNVSVVTTLLESLKEDDSTIPIATVNLFLQEFNTAFKKQVNKIISTEVMGKVMTFLFPYYIVEIQQMWRSIVEIQQDDALASFQVIFQHFLPGITAEVLTLIPLDISCSQYFYIFSAFNTVFDLLSEEIRQAVSDTIVSYLNFHVSSTAQAMVCSNLYNNTETYLTNIFFKFVKYANLSDISYFYTNFNMYDNLEVLSGKQLGNLMTNNTDFKNIMEAVQILLELKKRTYKDISDFIVEFNNVLEKKQIQYLADDIIVGLIFDTVWNQVSSRVQSSEDFQDWFTNKLKLVLSGATPSVISNISMDIDCSSQSAIVQGFSDVMEELSDDQIKIIVSRIKKYQTDMAEITGSACDSDKSSLEWIVSTCGQFKEYFSLADLKDLNKNFSEVAALPECTGSQIAEYVGSDRVLENKKLIITALNNLNTFDKVEDFYTKLNTMAATSLQTSSQIYVIFKSTFETISKSFQNFSESNYSTLFQVTLKNVLPGIQESDIEYIPFPLSCGSYQQVLHGFNNVYENMKDTSRQMIYDKVIKLQFNKTTSVSGSGCVSPGAKTQYWIDSNIGAFSVKAEYSDMMQWNEKFVATDVIEIFTARQLADMLVQSKKLNDEELLCQILGRLKHANISDVYMFLDRFNENIQKLSYTELLSETVRYKMLSESLLLIQDRLHLYSIIDWERLLSVRLQPFLSSITKVQLDIFLTYADYRIYAIIVKQLSKVFNDILADVRYSLYQSLFTFRSGKQFTGTFYPGSGENSKTRLELDFGKFISLVSYSDLLAIYPNLYGLDIIDILSAEQCARLIFDCDILNNETNANIFANKLQTFSFSEIDIFLTHFQTNANQRSLTFLKNGQIRTMFWNVIFSIVKGQFQNFTTTQWTDYWQYKLIVFIPSLNETQLDFMTSLTCEFFQITMAGLNKVYSKTPESTQKAIFQAAYTFLSAKNNSTGSACAANTQGSHGWLLTNFGYYSYYATYANFITLNAKFIATDTLSSLSVEQLAEYTLSSDTLKSIDKMTLIFSQLNVKNIGIFMDKFNLVASKMQLTELSSVEVNRFMLEKIIYILGSSFASFSIQEYTLWFRYRLKFFIIYFSTNIFASLPKNIGCEKLALLVNIFSNYTNNENPKDIYTFILSRLKSQVTPSGNACVNGTVSGKLWFVTYFGAFTTFLKWTDIIPVYSTIQVDDATGFLKEDDLYSIALSGSLAITVVSFYDFLAKIRGHAGILYTYIDQLRNYVTQVPTAVSVKFKKVVLLETTKLFFSKIPMATLNTVQQWFPKLDFLLKEINSTMLDAWKPDSPCSYFKLFNRQLNIIFKSLDQQQQTDVYTYVKNYLSFQVANTTSPCKDGTSNFTDWLQNVVGTNICSLANPDDIQKINTDFDSTTFTQVCTPAK